MLRTFCVTAASLLLLASATAAAPPTDASAPGDDAPPRRAWDVLRHALANNATEDVRAALAPDCELWDIDAAGARLRARGAVDAAEMLAADTGAAAGTGVALLPSRTFRVDDVVFAAETLPRLLGAPERLSIYRTHAGRVARIWRFPIVPRGTRSALDDVLAYRRAWSSGHWSEVGAEHAPDVRFLKLEGVALSELSSVDARRRCYESGFRRWRTLGAGRPYHPLVAGCDGGPIAVERAVAVGPYVATVERRFWASSANEWSLRTFLYVAEETGIRRVIYVLRW